MDARAISCAPALVVMIRMTLRKSALRAIIVSQGAVIHYLQQQVKHIRMSFLYFVKQQNAMRVFSHCFGKQPALIKPDISWRRTN